MSIFQPLVTLVKTTVNQIKHFDGVGNLFIELVSLLPSVLNSVQSLVKQNKSKEEIKQIIEDGLNEFDANTGIEGLKLIPGMDIDKMEKALDHFKEFIKLVLYDIANIEE